MVYGLMGNYFIPITQALAPHLGRMIANIWLLRLEIRLHKDHSIKSVLLIQQQHRLFKELGHIIK